jgi:arylsulfatase A-like enzyme
MRCFLSGLVVRLLLLVSAIVALTSPHIVFIIADDLGYNDVGFHQNKRSGANPGGLPTIQYAYLTPTIDALAAESARLDSYYVQPLCSPTRGAMLTGRYPSHTGIGPDVVLEPSPYGMPADETFLPERLRAAGYRTHLVGKHHLGYCDERYEPTFRGFETFTGYMEGATDYYNHKGDWRSSNASGVPGACSGVQGVYSPCLITAEVDRIVHAHDPSEPLFLWVAMQSVHNPYEAPPSWLVDVNATYAHIPDYAVRVYAGMVTALDLAVANVTRSLKDAGLDDDCVYVFVTDNGGIDFGNNYPLRGAKVLNWEGGIRGVGFVRGTVSDLAPVPAGAVGGLLHATDWFATVCRLAGIAPASRYPLDGFDVWDTIAHGAPSPRTSIVHNAPVGTAPVQNGTTWTTSSCMSGVDPAVGGYGGCHAFGVTGDAVRVGDMKLLVTYNGSAPWGDSSPPGVAQHAAFGFRPPANDSIPTPFRGAYFLFNISADPTESTNLAEARPAELAALLDFLEAYKATAIAGLNWRWGFHDPMWLNNGGCQGPFNGSLYCSYGHERGCFVHGTGLGGPDIGIAGGTSPEMCQAACAANASCAYFVYLERAEECHLKAAREAPYTCADCSYGPSFCPGLQPRGGARGSEAGGTE